MCQKTSAHWSDKLNASEDALTLRRAGIGALLVSIVAGMTSNLLFLAVCPPISNTRRQFPVMIGS
jgi:hypothetical protein